MPDDAPSIFHQDLPAFTAPSQEPASIFHTQPEAPSPGPANPVLNAATSAVSSWAEPLSNLALRGVNAVGGMSDQGLQRAIQTHPLAYDPQRVSGKIGAGIGQAGLAVGSGGAAPAVFGALGGEQEYENVEARRKGSPGVAPQEISAGQATADVLGQAGLNAGIGYLSPGGQATKGLLAAEAPTLAGSALRTLAAGGIGSAEMGGLNTAANLVRKGTGVAPQQDVTEGLGESLLQGSIFHGLPQAGHELGARLPAAPNALQAAREANTPAPSPTPDLDARLAAVSRDAPVSPDRQPEPTPPELDDKSLHTFERPEEVAQPDSFKSKFELKKLRDRLAAFQPTERRQPENVKELPPEEEQRWQNLVGERAAFQTPEETQGEVKPETPVAESSPAIEVPKSPSLVDKAKSLFGRLASEETGAAPTQAAGKAFIEQDVAPAIKRHWEGMKQVAKDFDRSENIGLTTGPTAKQESLNIIKAMADAKSAGRKTEAALAPFLEKMPTFKDNEASALHHADLLERGIAPSPELQPAVDYLTDLRQANEKEAKALGINNLNEEGLGLSRRFEFPEDPNKGNGSGSVTGSEVYRKSQAFPTYSEAYDAVKKQGGKPAYDNPLTDQIAAQYEFKRSIELRKRLRKSEDEGHVAWSPDKEVPPEGHVKLDDKIAQEERVAAYPKWVVGKYADMPSFEGNRFLKENENKRVFVRPGEDAPDGYSKTDHTERGQYHAADDVAHMWNTAANKGKGSALDRLPATIAKASTQFLYEYSGAHALGAFQSHLAKSSADAVSDLFKGDKTGLWNTLKDLNIYGPETTRILKEIKSPGSDPEPRVQEIARRIQQGGADIKTKSVLDANHWRDMVDKVKTGNWQGAAISSLKAVGEDVKAGTFNSVLNRIALIAGKREALKQIGAGISEEAGQASMRQAAEAVNRATGRHTEVPTFKDSVVSKVGKILMPAFGFRSGLVRNLAESIRNPHARAWVVGNLMTGAITGAAVCRLMGGRWPTSLQDLYNPPVGTTNEAGHEERISMGIWSFLPRLLGADGWEGVTHELKGMMNPMIPATGEVIKNKDFNGNQVRPTGDSALSNTAAGIKHVGKQLIPLVGKAQMPSSPEAEPPSLGERALHFAGWGSGHPVTSPAEHEAYQIMDEHGELGGRTPEKQAEHANQTKWVREIQRGQGDQANQEMAADPSMTPARHESIFKRAQTTQNLVRLMHSPSFGPDDLTRIWGKATDEDKATMKPALVERLGKAQPKSQAEAAKWQALQKAVQP